MLEKIIIVQVIEEKQRRREHHSYAVRSTVVRIGISWTMRGLSALTSSLHFNDKSSKL